MLDFDYNTTLWRHSFFIERKNEWMGRDGALKERERGVTVETNIRTKTSFKRLLDPGSSQQRYDFTVRWVYGESPEVKVVVGDVGRDIGMGVGVGSRRTVRGKRQRAKEVFPSSH